MMILESPIKLYADLDEAAAALAALPDGHRLAKAVMQGRDLIRHLSATAEAVSHAADALDAQAALLSEARDGIAGIITVQDIAIRTPAAARLSENEIASYRSLLHKLTGDTKP